jgi:hypothetical protein
VKLVWKQVVCGVPDRLFPSANMSDLRFLQEMVDAEVGEMTMKIITEELSKPVPSTCAVVINGSMMFLTNPDNTDTLKNPGCSMRRESTLDMLSRWISLRRSAAQVAEVLELSCTCSADVITSEIHQIGAVASEPEQYRDRTPGELLVIACTAILIDVQDQGAKLGIKPHRLARRKEWPRKSAQVLPHGPEDTVCGYMDWLVTNDIVVYSRIIEAFSLPTRYAWPLIVPVVIRRRLILDQYVDAATRWGNYLAKLTLTRITGRHIIQIEHILGIFSRTSALLWKIIHGWSDHTSVLFFLHGRQQDILVSCDRVIETSLSIVQRVNTAKSRTFSSQAQPYLSLTGAAIYNHFPGYRTFNTQLFSHPMFIRDAHPLHTPHIQLWTTFLNFLLHHRMRQRCTAYGCPRTPEELGRPFRYCTGCRQVSYCSRACQRNSWNRLDRPQHRDVCILIRYICLRYNVPRNSKPSLDLPPVPNLSQEEVGILGTINEHFAALTRLDLQE